MFRIERVGRRLGFIAIGGVVALVIACGGSGDDAAADPVPAVTPEESTVEPSATECDFV
mgnify:CR=1 FL=1